MFDDDNYEYKKFLHNRFLDDNLIYSLVAVNLVNTKSVGGPFSLGPLDLELRYLKFN